MFKPHKKIITIPQQPDVLYIPGFFTKEISDKYLSEILANINFTAETYNFQDQVIITKRKISYHSEKSYSYSNQIYQGKEWNPVLLDIKDSIEDSLQHEFNAVLVNHYIDGQAGMGWHADKEKELGSHPLIASVSFGQSRRFAFRHRRDIVGLKNPPKIIEYMLNSGDLLVMKGDTQQFFEHSLIKDKSSNNLRVNLTFRKIIT